MRYKTKDGSDAFVPGVGATIDGVIETDQVLEGPTLIPVAEQPAPPAPETNGISGVVTPADTATAVTVATPVTPQEQ